MLNCVQYATADARLVQARIVLNRVQYVTADGHVRILHRCACISKNRLQILSAEHALQTAWCLDRLVHDVQSANMQQVCFDRLTIGYAMAYMITAPTLMANMTLIVPMTLLCWV